MRLTFTPKGWTHYQHWQQSDRKMLAKLNRLLKEGLRHPYEGTGQPEALQNDYSGWWSRRIDQEHRLIYRVTGEGDAQALEVAQARYHYDSR